MLENHKGQHPSEGEQENGKKMQPPCALVGVWVGGGGWAGGRGDEGGGHICSRSRDPTHGMVPPPPQPKPVKSANSHKDRASRGRDPRNCRRF